MSFNDNEIKAGLEDGTLSDSKLSVSGSHANHWDVGRCRLSKDGFAADATKKNQWIEVDFGSKQTVVAILLAGRKNSTTDHSGNDQYLKSFYVSWYDQDFQAYTFDKDVYNGGTHQLQRFDLRKPVVTTKFRMIIGDYN